MLIELLLLDGFLYLQINHLSFFNIHFPNVTYNGVFIQHWQQFLLQFLNQGLLQLPEPIAFSFLFQFKFLRLLF
jgi:hypothetical protein